MRHGETEMNVHLGKTPIDSPGFEDPLFYDAALTQQGRQQARNAVAKVSKLQPPPQLVVTSPLSRAIDTALLAFEGRPCPVLVTPLARERLYLSADVGLEKDELMKKYPTVSFDCLSPGIWWYNGGSMDPKAVMREPSDVFWKRMEELRRFLAGMPEACIALIAHSDVLEHLTGLRFANAEIKTVTYPIALTLQLPE